MVTRRTKREARARASDARDAGAPAPAEAATAPPPPPTPPPPGRAEAARLLAEAVRALRRAGAADATVVWEAVPPGGVAAGAVAARDARGRPRGLGAAAEERAADAAEALARAELARRGRPLGPASGAVEIGTDGRPPAVRLDPDPRPRAARRGRAAG